MTFKHLEDLKDKYRGEEIWVLGRGPSLDDYPTNFFEGKVSIAVSYAYLAFPNCTYYSAFHAEPAEWVEKNWPDKFDRCILGCLQGSSYGDPQRRSKFEGSGEVPIYAKVFFGTGSDSGRFKAFVERLIAKKSCDLVDGITSLHTAIQVAIVLGAKKITLAGCELKMRGELIHAKRTWLSEVGEKAPVHGKKKWRSYFRRTVRRFFPASEKGLQWLVEICKPHGIEIVRYYHRKGYEQIEIP